ncbi:helix-turn-helix transcriptional regulator [Lutibaculum baratangense]|uniref:Transcriptional regulator, DeoR family n=1 Tax=Lutibaculum baratangense AMV1 TaxID=631454 RepID=V4QRQ7_9HYPH|nr:YafY family protein [Lutibaculum baratangense]ESR22417.1 Transcriptional regulator, DeoR family [Lutibaculum baratangense AMV1]
MRRADRLFAIIQMLRREKLFRARELAEKLEVSERTIYRDMQDLVASGVPIEGEAGVGYVLRGGYDLPTLMFTPEEIEALVLGARIVRSWADCALADAAADALAKVEAVLPAELREYMNEIALFAPDNHFSEPVCVDIAELRGAIKRRFKIAFSYCNKEGRSSARIVRPLLISFFGPVWTMSGWCELRKDFRTFRLDRIIDLVVLDQRFRPEPGKTLHDFLKADGHSAAAMAAEYARQ